MIDENTNDRLYIEKSEPGFIGVLYYEIDDGLDLGDRLYMEQTSVPMFIEMLSQCLSAYGRRCGNDNFQIYDSGHKPQSFYNIDNRRAEGLPNSGLSGFTICRSDAEYLLKQLSDIPATTSADITATTSTEAIATTSAESSREMLNRQLLEAAANGDLNAVGKALTSGADVNVQNQHKQSALHIAAEKGHLYAVAILLTADADIENSDVADITPLMVASFHGKTQVSYLLLRYGAVINRDLLNSLKLKVDIFEENAGGSGMVDPDYTAAWRKFYDFMVEKWNKQNEKVSP